MARLKLGWVGFCCCFLLIFAAAAAAAPFIHTHTYMHRKSTREQKGDTLTQAQIFSLVQKRWTSYTHALTQ